MRSVTFSLRSVFVKNKAVIALDINLMEGASSFLNTALEMLTVKV